MVRPKVRQHHDRFWERFDQPITRWASLLSLVLAVIGIGAWLLGFFDREPGIEAGPALKASGEELEYPADEQLVALDMDQAIRQVSGPNTPADPEYRDSVQVGPRSVIQVSTIVQNPLAGDDERRAEAVQLVVELPKAPAPSIESIGEVTAANLGPSAGYKVFDSASISATSDASVQVVQVRDFYLQRNTTSKPKFVFDEGSEIPTSRIIDESTESIYRFVITPTPDGTLGSNGEETFKVTFLADVTVIRL